MAALLRHAARRLVGIQRAQAAAVVEERRRLLPRLVHTDEEKKEDLYDLIAATENSGFHKYYWVNIELLKSLSVQIEPRPDDPEWCLVRRWKRRSDVIRPAGIVAGLFLGFASILLLLGLVDISQALLKERQEVEAAKENEVALG